MLQSALYWFKDLHLPGRVDRMRFRFKNQPLIYGIRCRATGKMYIGHTFVPQDRFYKHLIAHDYERSSPDLQDDIKKYSMKSLTVHIFELVQFPPHMHPSDYLSHITEIEQSYIDQWPSRKRYNVKNSYVER